MKYCMSYQKNSRYLDEVDELIITYNRKDTSLIDFLQLHQEQRIIIEIVDEQEFLDNKDIARFIALRKEYPELKNYAFKIGNYRNEATQTLSRYFRGRFPHFFSALVRDWDSLLGYLSLRPSDIYIVENLGFELDKVSKILHKYDVNVRVFPNIAQSAWKNTKDLKKFFIRPEDILTYSPYVDVCEFIEAEASQDTYYKIYAIDKKWFGKLNELLIDFDEPIDSRCILPDFAKRRKKCAKKCFKGQPCQMCEAIEGLAATLEKEEIYFKL